MEIRLVFLFHVIIVFTAICALEVKNPNHESEITPTEHEKDPKLCKSNSIFPL